MKLEAPNYYLPEQRKILCKACGHEIAGMVGRGRKRHFEHHANYREAKILFDDNSMHVTNICSACLPKIDAPAILDKLHLADVHYMERDVPGIRGLIRNRRALRVIAATNRPVALP